VKFETGDIVRIGKGKTEWEILLVGTDHANIRSLSSSQKRYGVPLASFTHVKKFEALNGQEEGKTEQTPDLEHVAGETPAEYKARTGKKLDGRITSYGRAILLALQPKLHLQGAKRPRRSKIMARKPQSK
jgi:hypothetical protein